MKGLVLEAQRAMLEENLPKRQKEATVIFLMILRLTPSHPSPPKSQKGLKEMLKEGLNRHPRRGHLAIGIAQVWQSQTAQITL